MTMMSLTRIGTAATVVVNLSRIVLMDPLAGGGTAIKLRDGEYVQVNESIKGILHSMVGISAGAEGGRWKTA